MERIAEEGYDLNNSRYISTAVANEEIDLQTVNGEMRSLEQKVTEAKDKHSFRMGEMRHGLLGEREVKGES